jgi:hypothetical protein
MIPRDAEIDFAIEWLHKILFILCNFIPTQIVSLTRFINTYSRFILLANISYRACTQW